MQRTKIEWCDYSWNPATGCQTNCWYCYARRMATRFHRSFQPTFHPERLNEPFNIRRPSRIFVCSAGELFGPWVPAEWQRRVLNVCAAAYWHTFLFLTKWPDQCGMVDFPPNCCIGATVDCQAGDDAPCRHFLPLESAQIYLEEVNAHHFLSFEPLLGPPPDDINLWNIEWVIIGAYTGPGARKYAPEPAWIQSILDAADRYEIPIFLKDNLRPYWPGKWRQEFPKELQ